MSSLAHTDNDRHAVPGDATAAAGHAAQYYVVPWELTTSTTGEPISLNCLYFDANGVMVGTQPMTNRNAFFCITQGGPNTLPRLPQPPKPVDVALFSAVARTLSASCLLNSSFTASGPADAPSVVVPVAPGATRGVILVFRYPATGVVQGLVATSDPEIKNSSDTSDHLV
ncbi:hypothetical protein CDL60_19085 [Roseateles noduli]|nr:hypothetical protein CDL60_19085 [Roseateles noduli]